VIPAAAVFIVGHYDERVVPIGETSRHRTYTRTVPPSTTTVCPVPNPSCIKNR
jgi:hypothetical protein